jgi:hypothetical protein
MHNCASPYSYIVLFSLHPPFKKSVLSHRKRLWSLGLHYEVPSSHHPPILSHSCSTVGSGTHHQPSSSALCVEEINSIVLPYCHHIFQLLALKSSKLIQLNTFKSVLLAGWKLWLQIHSKLRALLDKVWKGRRRRQRGTDFRCVFWILARGQMPIFQSQNLCVWGSKRG